MKNILRKREIGGYPSLETGVNGLSFPDCVFFNTARNALVSFLKSTQTKRVFLPMYLCTEVPRCLASHNIGFELMSIDERFEYSNLPNLAAGERLLAVDYFGIKRKYCERVVAEQPEGSVIIDSTHSFLAPPISRTASFCSLRKTLGLPDGAWLYAGPFEEIIQPVEREIGWNYAVHLLGRKDEDASTHYAAFRQAEESLGARPILGMSNLSHALLGNVDPIQVSKSRHEHWLRFHLAIGAKNQMPLDDLPRYPVVYYPFLHEDGKRLRASLIEKRIYIPQLWPKLEPYFSSNPIIQHWVENLLPLPMHHHQSVGDTQTVIDHVERLLH